MSLGQDRFESYGITTANLNDTQNMETSKVVQAKISIYLNQKLLVFEISI